MLIAIAYAALLLAYRWGWRALPERGLSEGFEPQTTITLLIPARNEAENIGLCLRSVLDGTYPPNLLEIIVLDDFSEDETVELVHQLPESLELLGSSISSICLADHLPPEARFTPNKKKAIELGVAQATGEIIVTTDADCIVPKEWLFLIASAFENPQTQIVCAPVAFHREKNLLQRFQSLDFLGLMGITGAGHQMGWHTMANGANLAFRKQVFEAVGGYAGNKHLASGDDMFLVQKVAARWPDSVTFLKSLEATVLTEAVPTWRAFWQQRLRWGTKNAALPSWPLRLSLLTVFLFCWSIWVNLAWGIAYTLVGVLANNQAAVVSVLANSLWVFLFQITVKAFFDYFFLSEMCRFFKREDLLRWFLPSFFLHTAYIALLGTASIFSKKYEWKGRRSS
ncbi:MAG: glycosyltransferase [Phycisphaerae bacterium]|nr:glycosyltransferase [Saprospiraceae bacterium]